MLENFGLVVAALFVLSGSGLLYDGAADTNAAFRLLGGATLLAAGLVAGALVLRSKLYWKRIEREDRRPQT
jgi:hypothetical protein